MKRIVKRGEVILAKARRVNNTCLKWESFHFPLKSSLFTFDNVTLGFILIFPIVESFMNLLDGRLDLMVMEPCVAWGKSSFHIDSVVEFLRRHACNPRLA